MSEQTPASIQAKRILLVEDNPDDETLTLKSFKKANILNEVVVAHDGAEALDYLAGSGAFEGRDVTDLPALILLDLKLPRVDGIQLLRKIRDDDNTALVPVVVLTSSDEETDLLKSYKAGANSYVRKPVEFDRFSAAIQQLGLYWLLVNEAPPRNS